MPVEHKYIVWGAVGVFGPLSPEVIRARSEEVAAEIYAGMRGVRDGRKIHVVRLKHVADYTAKRIVERV
jgi:hypothetical protein